MKKGWRSSGSFRRDAPAGRKGDDMSKKTVRHKADLGNLPKLTKQQKAELEALAKMSDADIDYSDIPPLSDEFWQKAMRNPFYKPTKQSTTMRIDSDVLLWLKSKGKGYQTRINKILREAMLKERGLRS
jgi:uncharacterized protein (DUF4415 family)